MKFRAKFSAFTMSLALVAVSFLSVASQKCDVHAAETAVVVETGRESEKSLVAENNDKKETIVLMPESDKVQLSKKEYKQLKKLVEYVPSIYRWTIYGLLFAIMFTSAGTGLAAAGFPIFGAVCSVAGKALRITSLMMFLIRGSQIADIE